jgi:ribosome biogenesis protein NSA2
MSEAEMFQVVKSGKRKKKCWKRKINMVTFVGENFVRKPPKYERYIRPSGLRFKKANVTHPELKTTISLAILGVKKNPQSALYTNLGVITKGTIIEVNVSEMGLVT